MLRKIILWAGILFSQSSWAQSVNGSWYGRADVVAQGTHNNYLTELVLRQKGSSVEGIFSYYFKDSYQSFFVRGRYNKETREVNINNLPMLLYASSARNGIECPMNFVGILLVNKVNSSISGSFFSDPKYKYTCPELRVTFSMDASQGNPTDILRDAVVGKKIWHPQEEDVVVDARERDTVVARAADPLPARDTTLAKVETGFKKPPTEPETAPTPAVRPRDTATVNPIATTAIPRKDSLTAINAEEAAGLKQQAEIISKKPATGSKPVTNSPAEAVAKSTTPADRAPARIAKADEEKLVEAFSKRKNVYAQDLEFTGDSIRISFYDNGDVDGDTISVFLNNTPILMKQEITDRGINIYIALDSLKTVSEISMFAENLGKYPPNTALMVVTDGVNRYEVFLSSSLEKNATVRIKRKKGGSGLLKKVKNLD